MRFADVRCECIECGRPAANRFPAGWLLGHDGLTCPWCAFPDAPKDERGIVLAPEGDRG